MCVGPYRFVKCPDLHTAAMDYRNIIWIKTEPTDEISTVPDSTVQVCPSTVNVKEELQECVNQEFPEHPLVTLESTNCSKEETQKKLGPEETENIVSNNVCEVLHVEQKIPWLIAECKGCVTKK
ncbi:uncharacterized protein LOC126426965 isoform X2 [Schistocerca serialis cubense]|uniref:uncharacterized protein LOC126426965 isoform X2 n=1 Tax=Schistocerca serialis cubense TaxID=2023355 RepID=UPI00214E60FE|nr:uncharacterized protein LOC126426965 isoform X2 [Schistocerca serialis cubense]